MWSQHIPGQTFHGRKGEIENAFRYSVDYVLMDAEREQEAPALFRRNRRGVFALADQDHGGAPGAGRSGAIWVRNVLYEAGFTDIGRIELSGASRVFWAMCSTRCPSG